MSLHAFSLPVRFACYRVYGSGDKAINLVVKTLSYYKVK